MLFVLFGCVCGFSPARADTALDFAPFPGLPPGGAIAADPTIHAIFSPGMGAPVGVARPIDTQGNGFPDLVLCHFASAPNNPKIKQPCRFLRPRPDGSMIDVTRQLLGPGPLPSVEHPRYFVIADFNHDGRQDLFVAAHGYDAPPHSGEANVLLISNPDGTYTDRSSTIPQAPDFSHSACAGDINGDGNLDIYVGNIKSGGSVVGPYFLLGNGDGTFVTARSGLPAKILSAEESFLSCAIVDIDGDGLQDLVLGTWSHQGYFDSIVLFGDGRGDFTRRPRSVLPASPFGDKTYVVQIVPLDVDRDGRPDLIILTLPIAEGVGLQVLINKGGGSFADETSTRIGPSALRLNGVGCIFIRLVDLDGDGWDDFYCDMPNWDAGEPRYWMNNGNGTWSPASTDRFPGGSNFGYMNPLDFDRDGRLDFVQVSHTPEGDVMYQSFQNRTPRTAPISRWVVEFYNKSLDHYFITWVPDEIAGLESGTSSKGWTRTGKAFRAFSGPAAEVTDICRIYIPPSRGDSHFFGRGTGECNATMTVHADFVLEEGKFMAMRMPNAGTCPFGLAPVYRVFSNRPDANHRYITDRATRTQMVSKGWLAEGDGPDMVVMCAGAQ